MFIDIENLYIQENSVNHYILSLYWTESDKYLPIPLRSFKTIQVDTV